MGNCIYAGMVKVPADAKRPERLVKALHPAIVSEGDFWLVQEMLGNKRPSKAQPEERFPLRGILKCWCGLHMTAGFSKGKRNYYLYYRCLKHTGTNISGITLHNQFNDLLRSLSFSPEQLTKISSLVSDKLKKSLGEKESLSKAKSAQLTELNRKIEKLEERLMNEEIEASTFKNWFQKYSSERAMLLKEIGSLKQNGTDKWQRMEKLMPALTNLFDIYEKANISAKNKLVKAVFKHNLVYSDGAFRTPFINDAFALNYLNTNKKGLLFVEQPLAFSGQNPFSSP